VFLRRSGSSGRWLGARMTTFGVGAVLALLGMGLRSDTLVLAAGVTLFAGVLLGLIARRQDRG